MYSTAVIVLYALQLTQIFHLLYVTRDNIHILLDHNYNKYCNLIGY
jgi:hypothetical protein